MKKTHKILLIVLLVAVVSGALPMTARAINIGMDGDLWNKTIEEFNRINQPEGATITLSSYVRGYWEAVVYDAAFYGSERQGPISEDYRNYINQLTEWYKDPANHKIPAYILLDFADSRFRGELSDQEIQQKFLELRKHMSNYYNSTK